MNKDANRTPRGTDGLLVQADPELNRQLSPILDRHHVPGLIGGIMRGETLAAIGAVGVRKIGSSEPMQVTDQVHIGSCTKALTATLIGMLVENGLLRWSTSIRDVFPEVASQLHPDFQTATLSHLLTHRAGLPHDAQWWRLPGRTTTEQRHAALLDLMSKSPLTKPGTVYAYSNAGYVIAGLMAEQLTRQPWEELMQERLFEPLTMMTAGFGPPGGSGRGRIDQPWGHQERSGKVESVRQDNAPCMGPAGTVHCSFPDWGKFAALHLRGAQGKARLLKASTFKALQTPPPGHEYAGGWNVVERPWAGGTALNHNGSNLSWYVALWIAPARDFATLVATNIGGDNGSEACEDATQTLIKYVAYAPTRRGPRR
jgi:CubicO group peptidase (beta-lactamase class C family)